MKKGKYLDCVLILAVLAVLVWLNPGCRDPHEFQPPEDTLVNPPGAPCLFHPMNDTFFLLYGSNNYPIYVTMEWSYIEETEFYLLQFAGRFDSLFKDNEPIEVYTNAYTMRIDSNDYYYWRACAYSPHWKWYTAWSPTWRFWTHYVKP